MGLAGLAVGLLLGLGLSALSDDDGDRAAVDGDAPVATTLPRTTTTAVTLPAECADAIRSAEQSLALLEQAFQSARQFDVTDLDRLLAELEELRRSLTERVRSCLDRA